MSSMTQQEEKVYEYLEQVKDPEVPALSILDLGIVRGVAINEEKEVAVTITPTYSGCPAMDTIGMNIRMALAGRGFSKIDIQLQLKPAWTTDWMSAEGKRKLKEYGIAPPLSNQIVDESLQRCAAASKAESSPTARAETTAAGASGL